MVLLADEMDSGISSAKLTRRCHDSGSGQDGYVKTVEV